MKKNNILKSLTGSILLTIATSAVYFQVSAREPFTKEELKAQEKKLLAAVEEGYNIWHGSNPAASNPQTFPKYHTAFDRVVTWREMANWCIQNPQGGKALDVSGREMLAIEAYAFNLHRGLPIEPGLASRQTKPIKVDYGKGFPSKPSGIGFDTK